MCRFYDDLVSFSSQSQFFLSTYFLQSFVEAYDLIKDPFELTNVADNIEFEKYVFYRNLLHKMEVCAGKNCRIWFNEHFYPNYKNTGCIKIENIEFSHKIIQHWNLLWMRFKNWIILQNIDYARKNPFTFLFIQLNSLHITYRKHLLQECMIEHIFFVSPINHPSTMSLCN